MFPNNSDFYLSIRKLHALSESLREPVAMSTAGVA